MSPSDEALAWVALLSAGRLGRARWNERAWEIAREAGWASTTPRRGEILLEARHRSAVVDRLRRLWPVWEAEAEALTAAGLPPSPSGWKALQEARRRAQLPDALPEALNQRTVAAALRERSKSRLLGAHDLPGTRITHDNLVRLRPHEGLVVAQGETRQRGVALAALCGELCLTDRGVRAGTRLEGAAPRAILLVENLGVYVDVPLPDGWCAAHVPGWNTRMVAVLREAWPAVPAVLFGDLDPNGVAIAQALQGVWPGLRWFVPDFAVEYLDRGHATTWPVIDGEVPEIVRVLEERGLWLEQEVFVLDPRLMAALEGVGGAG